ncbi:hypothetical protein K493DRAFT_350425 [Basidiobolus meristosporus CBS 931.73]|uniref:Uncharacterized protein n=1 Tax=Basidiobolus meristosporus CBS 931.73 TaxID=1314790 RepID=A0A1Y1YG25_9FUNG|nr:hypothetical protein K493DRAFT_350425 [Basidiobolus meristosporus CBS 931.73]|eukprot:ORX96939.1 hypothetical protein K493DRAFT_350425 [Basidiobolus meristosporus CBS 931.73]
MGKGALYLETISNHIEIPFTTINTLKATSQMTYSQPILYFNYDHTMRICTAFVVLAFLSQVVMGCTQNESKCSSEDAQTIVRCVNDGWVDTKCGQGTVCRQGDHTGPFCDHEDVEDDQEWGQDDDEEEEEEDNE